MTVRDVLCEFCFSLNDFQVMHQCPLCRKVICRRCKKDGPLEPGKCAKKIPCPMTPLPDSKSSRP